MDAQSQAESSRATTFLQMPESQVAVTGATGEVGGSVAKRLADRRAAQQLIVRDASRTPDLVRADVATATHLDPAAMVLALDSMDTVFFVSRFEAEDRLAHHKATGDAFVEARVRLGDRFVNAPRHSGSLYMNYEPRRGALAGFSMGAGVCAAGQQLAAQPNPSWELPRAGSAWSSTWATSGPTCGSTLR